MTRKFLGSFGHLSSAVVCAASSFSMSVVDPRPILLELDYEVLKQYKGGSSQMVVAEIDYTEPIFKKSKPTKQSIHFNVEDKLENRAPREIARPRLPLIKSRIARLGEFIDTDAVSFICYLPIWRIELLLIELGTLADTQTCPVARTWARIDKLCDRR